MPESELNANSDVIGKVVRELLEGAPLSQSKASDFFGAVVRGQVSDIHLTAAISAIKVRTQTAGELAGAAIALLKAATPFPQPDEDFCDIVGTGGDGHNTINLSTIAAITAATCGAKIIKHGNRSISSVSGSFDLLEKLNVPFDVSPEVARQQADKHGMTFLYAPNYHSGLRHAAKVRKTLAARTIFNLLGPLVNPARPPLMLLGVADESLLVPVASVLQRLGCRHAYVVHGSGVDEVAIHGSTSIVEVKGGELNEFEIAPSDFGTPSFPLELLTCHDAAISHQRSIDLMSGGGSYAERAAVAVNVAMLLRLFGRNDLKNNFALAIESLQEGRSMKRVEQLVADNSNNGLDS